MELSAEIMALLRDEALAAYCRETINRQLAELGRRKKAIEKPRSPFAIFGRREFKDEQARSLQTCEQSSDVLHGLLAQVQQLEELLRGSIRAGLDSYLEKASFNYQACRQAARSIASWQQGVRELPDFLTALAGELRSLRAVRAGVARPRALASVRQAVERLAARHQALTELARQANAQLQEAGGGVRLPDLRDLQQTTWVQRLNNIPAEQLELETTLVETALRKFLTEGIEAACAQAHQSFEACQAPADRHLEDYWNQLRTYSRDNYLPEGELEAAVQSLVERHAQRADGVTQAPVQLH